MTGTHHRLAFVITELDVGGAEKALVRIAIGLQQLGWKVSVISLRNKGPMSLPLEEANIEVHALGNRSMIRSVKSLTAVFRKLRPTLACGFLHEASLIGRMAAWRAQVPVFVSGVRVADRRLKVVWTERLTKHWVDHYVAVGRNVALVHSAACGIDASEISDIPNGVDIPDSMASTNGDTFRILFVGRLTHQKDPLAALSAFAKLPNDVRQTSRLTFVGDGELQSQLQTAVAKQQLTAHVQIVGHQTDVLSWMLESDLLLLPSIWEGMPNVVLEAMACGLPVLATDVDGISELIESGKTGWLVPPGDVSAMTEQLKTCRNTNRQKIALAARSFVQQNHSWPAVVQQYSERFQQLITEAKVADS